jgi:SAM-dependent methyltransferase
MEAAAVGTPSLAVDVSGVRDAIVDGSTGILVRGDESELPSVLTEALVALANDAPLRERLGTSAQKRAAQFGWDRTIDQWQAVLEEVAKQGVRPMPTMARMARMVLPIYSTATPSRSMGTTTAHRKDFVGELRRSINLLKGFRTQYDDPEGFYTLLAEDTVELVNDYQSVSGSRVVDVGGGPGYFAAAFRRWGAEGVFVEPFWDEMGERGRGLGYGIVGDGLKLPFADGSFDITHSSNVIEHVVDPEGFFDEMLRILRPGGTMFLAFTNWFSPFGGHETSPWHYLGGEHAVNRYERAHGHLPKNRFGTSLFRLDISDLLSWARNRQDADLIDAFPRYYPRWTKGIVAIPGLREVATWNLVIVMRRR